MQVPKKGQQGEVVVEGRSRSGVAAAASRLMPQICLLVQDFSWLFLILKDLEY